MHRSAPVCTVLSAAVLLSLGVPVFAQSAAAPAAASAAADAPQVVTVNASADASAGGLKPAYAGGQVARGGRVGILGSQDVMETPFAITNYTQKLVQDQQAESIADVVKNDAGVRVVRGFGNFQQAYMVRGLVVYSDDMSYNGLYGLLPRQYLAAELVERVEVLHGASAFLNGAAPGGSGLGGAINIAPKRAPSAPLSEITLGTETGGEVYSSLDLARRFGDNKALGLRLTAANRDGDTAVDGERRRLNVFSLGADWHSSNVRLSADLGSQEHNLISSMPSITIGSGLAVPRAPSASSRVAQPWTFSRERDAFGTLRAEVDFTPAITGWAAGGFRDGKEASSFANPTVTDEDGTVSNSRFDNARHDLVETAELGLRGKFRTGSVGHTVVASGTIYGLQSKNAYALSNGFAAGTIYAPVFVDAPDTPYVGGSLDDPFTTQRLQSASGALADTLSFLDDRLLVTAGVRYQHFHTYSYAYATGAENPAGEVASGRATPVAGVVFKASKQLSLYATYVEGLVAGDIAPGTVGALKIRNEGEVFSPYQTRQTEVGAKWDLGRFGGSLSLYQSRKANPTVADIVDGTGTYTSGDYQKNKGAELSFYGEAAPGLRILGGAGFLRARFQGTDEIGAPKSQLSLGVDWDTPFVPGLSVDAHAVHVASQYADQANTQRVPAWTTVDLGARYVVDIGSHALTLRARVENLTGRNYWASSGGYPGFGYLTVGDPRRTVVSGTVSF